MHACLIKVPAPALRPEVLLESDLPVTRLRGAWGGVGGERGMQHHTPRTWRGCAGTAGVQGGVQCNVPPSRLPSLPRPCLPARWKCSCGSTAATAACWQTAPQTGSAPSPCPADRVWVGGGGGAAPAGPGQQARALAGGARAAEPPGSSGGRWCESQSSLTAEERREEVERDTPTDAPPSHPPGSDQCGTAVPQGTAAPAPAQEPLRVECSGGGWWGRAGWRRRVCGAVVRRARAAEESSGAAAGNITRCRTAAPGAAPPTHLTWPGPARRASPQSRAARSRLWAAGRRSTSAGGACWREEAGRRGRRSVGVLRTLRDLQPPPTRRLAAPPPLAGTAPCSHLEPLADLRVHAGRQRQVVQPAAGVAAEARARLTRVERGRQAAPALGPVVPALHVGAPLQEAAHLRA